MAENRQYDHEYKVQAVKLAREIGQAKAAKELGVPKNTMYGWMRANRLGNLDLGVGSQTPQSAMTLNEELIQLRQQVKEQEKEIRRLKKENNFLEEASAFFAASRLNQQEKDKLRMSEGM
ncbi:transposase [Lachnospiraceae bacterium]|nr:transposase [Lachnospiraceae bacterium]